MLSITSLSQTSIDLAFGDRPADADTFHSRPVEIIPGVEIMGLHFDQVDFVIFFASVAVMSAGDAAFAQMMADEFNRKILPPSGARFVKFARLDATDDNSMFRQSSWQLANPHRLRGFQEELEFALSDHAVAFPLVPEYLFTPTTDKLDRMYQRMSVHFATGELGVTFALKYAPDSDIGGYYCYERK
ncbi:hypothetical protein OVY01_22420 [Robbsia sp. Bb-Pol-6]|uniref:Uncharacterized protein n=1 Tax=Robbsia betulipollinis TaxID=2981849 RepID=A0ABT3ZUG3_9BURK|nr:hypothetical protein [Robbsia betulipollinis]MCY0389897.1 hypothetical protein [Robbsia betulipollinis]